MSEDTLEKLNLLIQGVWRTLPEEATPTHEAFSQLIMFLDENLEVKSE